MYLTPFSSVSIIAFEQVNVSWAEIFDWENFRNIQIILNFGMHIPG